MSARRCVLATVLTVAVFGLSPIAIGAVHGLFNGGDTAAAQPFASPQAASTVSEVPILVSYLVRNAPKREFAPANRTQIDGKDTVGCSPRPGTSDSGLSMILVGFGLVGGAVFMRRVSPG